MSVLKNNRGLSDLRIMLSKLLMEFTVRAEKTALQSYLEYTNLKNTILGFFSAM